MILIAESGSTKTDWVLVNDQNDITMFKSMGFNPFFHSSEFIAEKIKENVEFYNASKNVERLYFYGAGCSSNEMNQIVKSGLSLVFPNSLITVDHDLLACALSTYKGEPAISCILGTGSNSCYYDGNDINMQINSLGYLLGDEGSGYALGRSFLKKYLRSELSDNTIKSFENEYKISKENFKIIYEKNSNRWISKISEFVNKNKEEEEKGIKPNKRTYKPAVFKMANYANNFGCKKK